MNKQSQPNTIKVAYNPITRKYERVYAESEVKGNAVITMVWSGNLNKYVVIN